MVRLLTASGIIVVSMATICAADVETFTWEEGRFTILFADKPKVGQQVIKLPVGDVTMHIFTAEFPKKTGEMVVSYSDYPAQVLATRKADEMLDDSVTGTIKGMKATLVKSDRIDQAGSPRRVSPGPGGQRSAQGQGPTLSRRAAALSGLDRRDGEKPPTGCVRHDLRVIRVQAAPWGDRHCEEKAR